MQKSLILTRYGNAFMGQGRNDSALVYFQNADSISDKVNGPKIENEIAKLYESNK